jgi:outer membrane cobalamin receptor
LKILISIAVVFSCFLSFGQLTEYELNEITVGDPITKTVDRILTLRRASILELQAEDVGQLVQKFAGVSIRSYGGLGGLKTISLRSLGSQHTSIVVDGFTLSNTQTGQINLGQIQTENIESIQLVSGGQNSYLVPSSVQVSGSAVMIESFENTFSSEKNQVRFTSKIGSFGQLDHYLSYKFSGKNFFVAAFGKYRFADGKYPFTIQNGKNEYTGTRLNNHFEDAQVGISAGIKLGKSGCLNLAYKKEYMDQELPGAVILYSSTASQTLKTGGNRFQVAYLNQFNKISIRFFGAYQQMNLNYTDSSFLNDAGGIYSNYRNDIVQIGTNIRWMLNEKWNIFAGTEEQYSTLNTSELGFGFPQRFHNFSNLGSSYSRGKMKFTAQFSTQYISEENKLVKRDEVFRINPFLQVESLEYGKTWRFTWNLFYRNSFRIPSFNELYYNNVGNVNLKPENADQLAAGISVSPKYKKWSFVKRTNMYFNQVRDKIVAIPTKNLFIWSMQNVGKVNIFGIETSIDAQYSINSKWSISAALNYTFQSATDITDRNSPTFGHQIAYVPKHVGNADLTLKWKQSGLRISNFTNSLRYSLNENIPSNQVNGFVVTDLAIFTRLPIKNHDFRLQSSCKNCFNSSYAIIRYYVMPGRNYLISLNYAFK